MLRLKTAGAARHKSPDYVRRLAPVGASNLAAVNIKFLLFGWAFEIVAAGGFNLLLYLFYCFTMLRLKTAGTAKHKSPDYVRRLAPVGDACQAQTEAE